MFQGGKSTIACILCQAPWLHYTHRPPPSAPIPGVLPCATGRENLLTDLL